MAVIITPQTIEKLDDGLYDVVWTVDDGGKPFKEHVRVHSVTELIAIANRKVELLSGGSNEFKALLALISTPLDLTPVVDPGPTGRDLFAADVALLKSMQRAIDLTVITVADANYIAQLASVVADLAATPEWIDAF